MSTKRRSLSGKYLKKDGYFTGHPTDPDWPFRKGDNACTFCEQDFDAEQIEMLENGEMGVKDVECVVEECPVKMWIRSKKDGCMTTTTHIITLWIQTTTSLHEEMRVLARLERLRFIDVGLAIMTTANRMQERCHELLEVGGGDSAGAKALLRTILDAVAWDEIATVYIADVDKERA